MISDWIGYILFGLVGGLSEILPVSASANGQLLWLLLGPEGDISFARLMTFAGSLAAVLINCGRSLIHAGRQLRIARQPARRRRRMTDPNAVRDARVFMAALVPLCTAVLLCRSGANRLTSLPAMSGMLALTGILVYIPQHFPGGNRDSRGMSRMDGLLLGLAGGLGLLPGMSAMGAMLCVGLLRGCSREYIVEMALYLCIPALCMCTLLELLAVAAAGFAGITMEVLLLGVMAGAAAFAGALGGISVLRYLAVRVGFSGFAYYSWGLAMFSFMLYLMI